MLITRKNFVLAVGALVAGCGDDGSSSGSGGSGTGGSGTGGTATGGNGTGGTPGTGGTGGVGGGIQILTCQSAIASNHGHELIVTAEDVNAGVDKTYDIQGTSAHSHSVTVTSADFAVLSTGGSVTILSSKDGHSHSVDVTCVV